MTKSRGVGVLLSSRLRYKLENFSHDQEGRLICLDLSMAGSKIRIINVYAPNNPAGRNQFINNLQNYLMTSKEIILGGDFNCIENLELDKMGRNLERASGGANNLLKLKNDFFLVDAFRKKYTKKKDYSWRGGPVHVRLDCFYIPIH